jgi:hypothetical protein
VSRGITTLRPGLSIVNPKTGDVTVFSWAVTVEWQAPGELEDIANRYIRKALSERRACVDHTLDHFTSEIMTGGAPGPKKGKPRK